VFFDAQKLLILMMSDLSAFSFVSSAFGITQEITAKFCVMKLSPVFC
jgi:hypothetical protein